MTRQPREKTARQSEYSEKLRDPRWQRKRLEILQRDDFSCQNCGDDTKTLNVHHCFYRKDAQPWEYPAESLMTLCEDCHQVETDVTKEIRSELMNSLGSRGVTATAIQRFIESLDDFPMVERADAFIDAISWVYRNPLVQQLVIDLAESQSFWCDQLDMPRYKRYVANKRGPS